MDNEIILEDQKIETEISKKPKLNKSLTIILLVIIAVLLVIVGVGAYFYLNQTKCASSVKVADNSNEVAVSDSTNGKLSDDVYKIYTYTNSSVTVNGDQCDSTSVLSLYKDQSIAVLSDSSCFGGEIKIGTYDVYADKVMIEFQTRVGLDSQSKLDFHEDISNNGSGNILTMTLNNDGTATSSLFDGIRTYLKK